MCGRIPQWSHQVLSFSWLGGFWLLIQSPYSLLICSDFISSWFSLGKMYVSGNLSISSGLFSLLVFTIVSSDFYFCGIGCNVSSFISNFTWVFSLFSLVSKLSILFFFKKQNFLIFNNFILLFYSVFYLFLLESLSFPSFSNFRISSFFASLFEIFLF